MPFIDRDSFLGLLDRLGDPDDATVVTAAREIHARLQAAGVSWDALLVRADVDEDGDFDADHDPVGDDGIRPAGDAADRARIERLLALRTLSDVTRTELQDYLTDIARGDFTELDSRYVRDLETRLNGRRTGL